MKRTQKRYAHCNERRAQKKARIPLAVMRACKRAFRSKGFSQCFVRRMMALPANWKIEMITRMISTVSQIMSR